MPTESTFLFAGLLFLAAALGYVFARFGDTDEEEEAEQAARTRLVKGFRYLLNDESDRAVDAFTAANDPSDDAVDTQLALGTLFRRRGELDRAIRLHQDLVDRPASTLAQREAAAFALAEDYLGAGLFDRAEELFLGLRDSRPHGIEARKRLLRIAEVTRDWERAVDLGLEINRVAPGSVEAARLAHYYCELAEAARGRQDAGMAGAMLLRAESVEPGKPRSLLIRADLAADRGNAREAVEQLGKLGPGDPAVLDAVVPRLLTWHGRPEFREAAARQLAVIGATAPGLRGIALAILRDNRRDDPLAMAYLTDFIGRQPVLSALLPAGERGAGDLANLERVRPLLGRLLKAGMRFQCGNCGYESIASQWQCPGCRAWDTVRPVTSDLLQEILG